MSGRIGFTFDCADPAALARFWAEALGYRLGGDAAEPAASGEPVALCSIEPPEDGLPGVDFQRVPEGKVAKNRLHLDLRVAGDGTPEERRARVHAEAARLVALGASDHRGAIDEGGSYWIRMNDPEGNEFCLV